MAFRPLLRQRAVVPVLAGAVASTSMLAASGRSVYAEEHNPDSNRKPIYDDTVLDIAQATSTPSPAASSTPTPPESASKSYRPTPTDRLAVQIGYARLFAHKQAARLEDSVNDALTSTLRLEHSFTTTVRSLAPPRESGEKIFPGVLYVLVASMAGSIITRNRNLLLRASVPLAVGLGAAYSVLPITMKNVGDLAWTYEKRYPVVADAHLGAKARAQRFWETGKAHSQMSMGLVTNKVEETRVRLEDWVKKGH